MCCDKRQFHAKIMVSACLDITVEHSGLGKIKNRKNGTFATTHFRV